MTGVATLASLLSRAYEARILRTESVATVRTEFEDALADPDFAKAARAKLAGLTEMEEHLMRIGAPPGSLGQRDFLAGVYRDVLREWLGDK